MLGVYFLLQERFSINVYEFSISWGRQRLWRSEHVRIRARFCSPTGPDQPRPAPTGPAPGFTAGRSRIGPAKPPKSGIDFL